MGVKRGRGRSGAASGAGTPSEGRRQVRLRVVRKPQLQSELTPEAVEAVARACNTTSSRELRTQQYFSSTLPGRGAAVVRGKDMQRLAPGVWLNDAIINCFTGLVQEREMTRRGPNDPTPHVFHSFFVPELMGEEENHRLWRWTRPGDGEVRGAPLRALEPSAQACAGPTLQGGRGGLGYCLLRDCDVLIAPVNFRGCHWTVIAAENVLGAFEGATGARDSKPRLRYIDSLDGGEEFARAVMHNFAEWIMDESFRHSEVQGLCAKCYKRRPLSGVHDWEQKIDRSGKQVRAGNVALSAPRPVR